MPKKVDLAVALIVTALVLYLSLRFFTHAGPLWRDEAATLHFATQPTYADVLRSLDLMSLPALYPTLVRAWSWLGWGNTDVGARAFGLLVAVAVLGMIWLCARALDGEPPLLTLALGAAHGVVLSTTGLLRPYGLGMIFLLATTCAVWRVVSVPRIATFFVAAAAATLAVQCQYQNILFIAVICGSGAVVSLIGRDRKAAALVAGAGLAAALSLLPYVSVVQRSHKWMVLVATLSPTRLDWLFIRFVDLLSQDRRPMLAIWTVAVALACYGAGRTLWASRGADAVGTRRMIYGVLIMLGSTTALLVFFKSADRFLQQWHVVPLIALLALSLDMIFAPPVWPRAVRLAIAIVAVAVGLPTAMAQVDTRQTNVDLIARYLEREASSGDLIVIDPWFIGITFNRYYQGDVESMTVPPIGDLRIHRFDLEREQMISPEPLNPLKKAIVRALENGHRVWIVGGAHVLPAGFTPRELPPAPLPATGWSDAPYTINWSVQLAHFLQTHGRRRYVISIPVAQPVNGYENASLSMFEGWAG